MLAGFGTLVRHGSLLLGTGDLLWSIDPSCPVRTSGSATYQRAGAFAPPEPHPLGINVAPSQVAYSAENSTRAVDLLLSILERCRDKPKPPARDWSQGMARPPRPWPGRQRHTRPYTALQTTTCGVRGHPAHNNLCARRIQLVVATPPAVDGFDSSSFSASTGVCHFKVLRGRPLRATASAAFLSPSQPNPVVVPSTPSLLRCCDDPLNPGYAPSRK
jgi:hypothetical protein